MEQPDLALGPPSRTEQPRYDWARLEIVEEYYQQ